MKKGLVILLCSTLTLASAGHTFAGEKDVPRVMSSPVACQVSSCNDECYHTVISNDNK